MTGPLGTDAFEPPPVTLTLDGPEARHVRLELDTCTNAVVDLEPDQARSLAADLLNMADEAES